MRIASLLSSATEIVFELGLQQQLVAISHECDFPPEALALPRLSRSRFDPAGLTSGEIDTAVRESMREHGSVYEVDADALGRLAPDLVLTQAVCDVCAVPTASVEAAIASLERHPRVVSLDAHTIDGILASIQQVADAAGSAERGRVAVAHLRERLDRVRRLPADDPPPRVLALEWLSPPFAPGHWVPEMIEWAGGECLLGTAGSRSTAIRWEEVQGFDPDVLLLLPCGFDLRQARADAEAHREPLERAAARAIVERRAWIGSGAFFSRSGPRIVAGIEAVAAVLRAGTPIPHTLVGKLERW